MAYSLPYFQLVVLEMFFGRLDRWQAGQVLLFVSLHWVIPTNCIRMSSIFRCCGGAAHRPGGCAGLAERAGLLAGAAHATGWTQPGELPRGAGPW